MQMARSIARRWSFVEDVEQAALLGLHLADVSAAPDMPPEEFRSYAAVRIKGETIDHLRRVAHGGRLQGKRALRPRNPEPESVGMAIELGLIVSRFSRESDPETQAVSLEKARSVAAQVDALPERTRDMLLRRLTGEPESEIARDYGVAIPRVNQLCWAAARSIGRGG